MAIIYLSSTLLMNFSSLPKEYPGRTTPTPKGNSSYLTLLRMGFTLIPIYQDSQRTSDITAEAVGSYPAFSPLPRQSEVVYFCGTFRESTIIIDPPGVTRHPVLRSSDFPLLSFTYVEQQLPSLNNQRLFFYFIY